LSAFIVADTLFTEIPGQNTHFLVCAKFMKSSHFLHPSPPKKKPGAKVLFMVQQVCQLKKKYFGNNLA